MDNIIMVAINTPQLLFRKLTFSRKHSKTCLIILILGIVILFIYLSTSKTISSDMQANTEITQTMITHNPRLKNKKQMSDETKHKNKILTHLKTSKQENKTSFIDLDKLSVINKIEKNSISNESNTVKTNITAINRNKSRLDLDLLSKKKKEFTKLVRSNAKSKSDPKKSRKKIEKTNRDENELEAEIDLSFMDSHNTPILQKIAKNRNENKFSRLYSKNLKLNEEEQILRYINNKQTQNLKNTENSRNFLSRDIDNQDLDHYKSSKPINEIVEYVNRYKIIVKLKPEEEKKITKIVYPNIQRAANPRCPSKLNYDFFVETLSYSHLKLYTEEDRYLKRMSVHLWGAFSPLLNKQSKERIFENLAVMDKALTEHHIPYLVMWGSLIGLLRFQDLNPWDDDVDIYISMRHWNRVAEVLGCMQGYTLAVRERMQWFFYKSSSRNHEESYPFIDIYFYEENDYLVWAVAKMLRKISICPKSFLLPPKSATFMGLQVQIPHDPVRLLTLRYGDLNTCKPQSLPHHSSKRRQVFIPCSKLFPVYGDFTIPYPETWDDT